MQEHASANEKNVIVSRGTGEDGRYSTKFQDSESLIRWSRHIELGVKSHVGSKGPHEAALGSGEGCPSGAWQAAPTGGGQPCKAWTWPEASIASERRMDGFDCVGRNTR